MDDALLQAVEAIECHIEGLLLDGEQIPAPQSIEAHHHNPVYEGGIWAVAAVDISKLSGKSKRVNITVPERLLTTMDQYAAEHGKTRSGLIAEAAIAYNAAHDDSEE